MREPKPYEIVIYEGEQAYKYADGTIRNELGHVLELPIERAKAMQIQRVIKGQLSALQGLQDATGADTPEQGWRMIVKKRAERALKDDTRAGTEAARFVGKAAGFIQQESPDRLTINQTANLVDISPELKAYIKQLSAALGEDVIEAEDDE